MAAAVIVSAVAAAAGQGRPVPPTFSDIAKRAEPAVVSIEAKSRNVQSAPRTNSAPSDSDDILDFFRRQMRQRPVYAVGSGFIVDPSGYVITNFHVIDDSSRITVKLDSGDEFAARVVGADEETDIAVLKIEAGRELPFLRLGDSEKVEVGDWVLAMGSPFGLAKSVTAGIISQTQRETPYASAFQRFIQTDAAINRGNSGGPLINLDGEVIGVNSQIATSTGDYNGVGFALPSNETERVYRQIVQNGKVRRGYLGAFLESVKPEFAKVYGLGTARGAIITEIRDKQGPAAAADLKAGDIVLRFNGTLVENAQDLIAKVAATAPDAAVSIDYLREAGTKLESGTATVRLGERPTNRVAGTDDDRRVLPADGARQDDRPLGLTLSELTPALAATYKLEGQKGILVKEVNPASYIADVRGSTGEPALGAGDLIQRINRITVASIKNFADVAAKLKPGDPVVLHVVSYNPQTRSVQLKIVQFTVR